MLSVLPSRSAADACASAREFLQRSQAALGSGDHAAGLEHAEQALQHAAADSSERAEALTQQSTHQWRLGRFEDAADSGRCALLCHLAVAYSELGLHEEALRHATESFDCARVHGLRGREVQALNRIGICFERLGDPAQGERFLLQSLGEARDMHDDDGTLVALNNLVATTVGACHLYKQRGEHDASRQAIERGRSYATQAVALARRLGDAYRQTVIEGKALGKFEPALAHCEAHHAMELQRAALQNQAQARLMINRVEVEHQLALAERARQVSR